MTTLATWEDTPEELANVLPADFDERARIVLLPAGYAYGRNREALAVWRRVRDEHPRYRDAIGPMLPVAGIALVRLIADAREHGVHIGPTAIGQQALRLLCGAYAATDSWLPYGVDQVACRRAGAALDRLTLEGSAALLHIADWCLGESLAAFVA